MYHTEVTKICQFTLNVQQSLVQCIYLSSTDTATGETRQPKSGN